MGGGNSTPYFFSCVFINRSAEPQTREFLNNGELIK